MVIHELQHGLGFLSLVGQSRYTSLVGSSIDNTNNEEDSYIFDRFVRKASDQEPLQLVWDSPSFDKDKLPKLYTLPDAFTRVESHREAWQIYTTSVS